MNTDYLDDFCLEEEPDSFADYLLSKATKDDMEAYVSQRVVLLRYLEYIATCEEDISAAGPYEDEEAV